MRPNFRPSFSQGPRYRIKTFDPSVLVRNTASVSHVPEVVIEIRHKFTDFNLFPKLMENILAKNYITPTPIQDQVIPLLLEGKDLVGMANTGTGKTASFLIPLINKVLLNRANKVLVLAPTRELAVQIEDEFREFARQTGLRSALCIGGVSMGGQIRNLSFDPQFIIGTPGRIKDLGEQGRIPFAKINNVILDEVDRMLDMGFIHDMTAILARISPQRQSAFFSATVPDSMQMIMQRFLTNPVKISAKTSNTVKNIKQEMVQTNGKAKIEVLHSLLIKEGFDKVLVFGRTKRGLERLAGDLEKRGFRVASIHGNKSQGARQKSLDMFKRNQVKILLATDVASRGLDIDDITHVINFDLPESAEDYTHRIGRTGRANKTGIALTLI